jgi:predicted acyltransferase
MVSVKDRLVSLDVFRGMTMACMILVENPGNWHIYKPLRHARWGMAGNNGLPVHKSITPTDLIMPFFLFIVGISIVFALWKYRDNTTAHRQSIIKITRRSIILFVLGLVFYAYPSILGFLLYGSDVSIRIVGVLQRIAVVYFVSSIIFLKCSPKTIFWICCAILIAYWVCTFIPVPGYLDPQFFRQYNTPGTVPSCFPEWVDTKILGFAQPEGILSTFPSVVTGLIGVLTGFLLKTGKNKMKVFRKMLLYGALLLLAGYGWSIFFPIIKDLWTSSYTLVAGGYGLITFALIYWLVDIKKIAGWTPPFVAFGVNCITVYFMSHIVSSTLNVIQVPAGGKSISLHKWINVNLFQSWLSPLNASLIFALLVVVFWLIPLWFMYKKRILIKV